MADPMTGVDPNRVRYDRQPGGHYESFFFRANHRSRPLAFWIRYTVFSPRGNSGTAIGELWAIWFDGETGSHVAVKRELPFAECTFSPAGGAVRIGGASFVPGAIVGEIASATGRIAWDLRYDGDCPPLLLLPPQLYGTRLPAAKSLVGLPLARFAGRLVVGDREVAIDDWIGSQNHNWGSRHTDRYAWGQVAGFDDHPDTFLEVATAKLRVGPLWTPALTPLVLRHRGETHSLTGLVRAVRAEGRVGYFDWRFASGDGRIEVSGRISARREDFVGLRYANPPGGIKQCLNSKIADCALELHDRRRGTRETLVASRRAAFEILTDDTGHGVPLAV